MSCNASRFSFSSWPFWCSPSPRRLRCAIAWATILLGRTQRLTTLIDYPRLPLLRAIVIVWVGMSVPVPKR